MGVHSTYTDEIGSIICERLAEGESLATICKDDDMPCTATVRHWRDGKRGADDKFVADYARARQDQADFYFSQIIEIGLSAVDSPDSDKTGALRLQSDNVKWTLERMNRAKYGARQAIDHGNQPDNPLTASKEAQAVYDALPDDARKAIAKALQEGMMEEGGE